MHQRESGIINRAKTTADITSSSIGWSATTNQSQQCAGTYGDTATADLSYASTSGSNGGTVDPATGLILNPGATALSTYYFNLYPSAVYYPNIYQVPVLIDTYLTTGVTGGGYLNHDYAEATLSIDHKGYQAYACSGYGCNWAATYDGTSTIYVDILNPYSQHSVSLSARIILSSADPNSALAVADPYIRIDPAFLAQYPGFSLEFSPGVTNAPTVPLPSAAWLFGSGLLGLTGVIRRRKAA